MFSSSLWSTVNAEMAPPWASKIQRESPTEATVTVHPSIITNVAVVPEVCPVEEKHGDHWSCSSTAYKKNSDRLERYSCLCSGILCQSSQIQQLVPEVKHEATPPAQAHQELHSKCDSSNYPSNKLQQHFHCVHQKPEQRLKISNIS